MWSEQGCKDRDYRPMDKTSASLATVLPMGVHGFQPHRPQCKTAGWDLVFNGEYYGTLDYAFDLPTACLKQNSFLMIVRTRFVVQWEVFHIFWED